MFHPFLRGSAHRLERCVQVLLHILRPRGDKRCSLVFLRKKAVRPKQLCAKWKILACIRIG